MKETPKFISSYLNPQVLDTKQKVDEVNYFEKSLSWHNPFTWKLGDTCYWVKKWEK